MSSKSRVRMLTEGAIMVAMALVLGLLKFFELPQAGAVSLEMLPLCFFCYRWGVGPGFLCCAAFSILQVFVQGAVSWGWVSILLDYLAAYTVIGVAGLGKGKPGGIYWGTLLGAFARFLVHFISGITVYRIVAPTQLFGTVWDQPELYSAVYNGSFMLIDTVLCLVIFALLQRPLARYFRGEDMG